MTTWTLRSPTAAAEVWSTGAGLHRLEFNIGGRKFQPLAEAAWQDRFDRNPDRRLPRHLQLLGGEWPCVPFGTTGDDDAHHGFGSDHEWHLLERTGSSISLGIEYPSTSPVDTVMREVVLAADRPCAELSMSISVRRPCRLPIAAHPIVCVPPGEPVTIRPGPFEVAATIPSEFAPDTSRLDPASVIVDGTAQTSLDGTPVPVWHIEPGRAGSEELVQTFGASDTVTVEYPGVGVATTLSWDALPGLESTVGEPFYGIGIEPTSSFFDRNDEATASDVPTGVRAHLPFGTELRPGDPWTTSYTLTATRLPEDATSAPDGR